MVVSFLDGTFEDLAYDLTTTIKEAVEELAQAINLTNHSTFSIFTLRKFFGKIAPLVKEALLSEEHQDAGDASFLVDALADIRKMKSDATREQSDDHANRFGFQKSECSERAMSRSMNPRFHCSHTCRRNTIS